VKVKNEFGTTLIEIIVAVVIAGIVFSLIMAFYSNTIKGFWTSTNNSENVKESIVTKMKIEKAISEIENGVVVSWQKDEVVYNKNQDVGIGLDSVVRIRWQQNAILKGNDTLATNISAFDFNLETNITVPGVTKGLLSWEATVRTNGWVGGAGSVLYLQK